MSIHDIAVFAAASYLTGAAFIYFWAANHAALKEESRAVKAIACAALALSWPALAIFSVAVAFMPEKKK